SRIGEACVRRKALLDLAPEFRAAPLQYLDLPADVADCAWQLLVGWRRKQSAQEIRERSDTLRRVLFLARELGQLLIVDLGRRRARRKRPLHCRSARGIRQAERFGDRVDATDTHPRGRKLGQQRDIALENLVAPERARDAAALGRVVGTPLLE